MAQPTLARTQDPGQPTAIPPQLVVSTRGPKRGSEPEPDRASDNIIRSKVQAPVVRDSTLPRERLLNWLDQQGHERVRVIAAEAGYGKTTLLGDWARRNDHQILWLKLDSTDAEWSTFISYLIAAFREVHPEFGIATQRLLAHVATLGTTANQATSQFLGELSAAIETRTVLIIDDLQHLNGSAEVSQILERLIERAPPDLAFILSGRTKPDLRLGRLAAQGVVVTLGTDDLRFTRQETRELFATSYRMPLESDLVSMVDARTEGWGASLQLLYSSIRSQPAEEIRDFISSLHGSDLPLYDFLAEEVLGRQTPVMQRVLLHAALLDRIVPAWVVAALAATPDALGADEVTDALNDADELGLMSRNAQRSTSRRFHPLLREFLASQLVSTTPPDLLLEIHRRIARAAEATDWPTSAYHFIEAGDGEEAMRVIGDASINALGTGAWGQAMDLVKRIPEVAPSVAVQVIRARSLVSTGEAVQAVALLEALFNDVRQSPSDHALVRFALASTLGQTDRLQELWPLLRDAIDDPSTPALLATLAHSWLEMHTSTDWHRVRRRMLETANECADAKLFLYAGLASHNASVAALAAGEMESAIVDAEGAIVYFGLTRTDDGHVGSTHSVISQAAFDLGDFARSDVARARAIKAGGTNIDVYAEAAILDVWSGRTDDAARLIERGEQLAKEWPRSDHIRAVMTIARSIERMSTGDNSTGRDLAQAADLVNMDPNLSGLVLFVRALSSALADSADSAIAVAKEALGEVERRGLLRYGAQIRLVSALASGDYERAREMFKSDNSLTTGTGLACAELIVRHLDGIHESPVRLQQMVRSWPARWRPLLRRAVLDAGPKHGVWAARHLGLIGEEEDVRLIRKWEDRQPKSSRNRTMSTALAKRIAPTLRISDLGRASFAVADRVVMIAEVRRKAATLLLYLASRPRQTATREQVLESLWPEATLDQAANSLHQTLYFLRRELSPRDDDERPLVEYVPVESEIVFLDADLVQVESAAFFRQASELLARDASGPAARTLLASYRSPFAPEVEYEEWAVAWRGQVHGAFLALAEQAARVRLQAKRFTDAVALLGHACVVDPSALELRSLLAVALAESGSTAAARQAYAQFRAEYREVFDEDPDTLEQLIAVNRRARSDRGGGLPA